MAAHIGLADIVNGFSANLRGTTESMVLARWRKWSKAIDGMNIR